MNKNRTKLTPSSELSRTLSRRPDPEMRTAISRAAENHRAGARIEIEAEVATGGVEAVRAGAAGPEVALVRAGIRKAKGTRGDPIRLIAARVGNLMVRGSLSR